MNSLSGRCCRYEVVGAGLELELFSEIFESFTSFVQWDKGTPETRNCIRVGRHQERSQNEQGRQYLTSQNDGHSCLQYKPSFVMNMDAEAGAPLRIAR